MPHDAAGSTLFTKKKSIVGERNAFLLVEIIT